jgi:hypothetical protein
MMPPGPPIAAPSSSTVTLSPSELRQPTAQPSLGGLTDGIGVFIFPPLNPPTHLPTRLTPSTQRGPTPSHSSEGVHLLGAHVPVVVV